MPAFPNNASHWLLRHPYGRDLLACKLRQARPDLRFNHYHLGVELMPLLELMIDLLELRDWSEPRTRRERIATSVLLLRTIFAFKMGWPLPRRG